MQPAPEPRAARAARPRLRVLPAPGSPEPLRALVFTTVYPNVVQPLHGLFVRERVRGLPPHVDARVLAPVPWFPLANRLRPGLRPRVPRRELQEGGAVEHPRFVSVPAVLKSLDGVFLAAAALPAARAMHHERPFDVIDAHFAYPDGLAAVLMGRALGVPVCITLRGTLPLIARHRLRRPQLRHALRSAARLIAVSESLRASAVALGVPAERLRVIRNGIDLRRFVARDRGECRRRLGLAGDGPLVVSVGHLSARKGFDVLIDALATLRRRHPRLRLLVVGGAGAEGFVLDRLRARAGELQVADAVTFAGARDAAELPDWYGAADVFALASAHEGCPNVVLEALACGTPVVATAVGDVAAMVDDGRTGRVVAERSPEAFAAAIDEVLGRRWDRAALRAAVAARDWRVVGGEVAAELAAACGRAADHAEVGR